MDFKLVLYPDPVLAVKSAPLSAGELAAGLLDGLTFAQLRQDMAQCMYDHQGTGLAANQVGITRRFFVIDPYATDEERRGNPVLFLNPEIVTQAEPAFEEEGCLSLPEIRARVSRSQRLQVHFVDVEGRWRKMELEGFFARAFQHELDHINGLLFVDRLSLPARVRLRGALKQLEREYQAAQRRQRGRVRR